MKLPRLKGIEDACRRIRPYLPETPLVRSEVLSRAFAAEVWLKNETVSPIASFKLRGALCEVLRARDVGFVKGVVTSSTGNHGQGVAFACAPAWDFGRSLPAGRCEPTEEGNDSRPWRGDPTKRDATLMRPRLRREPSLLLKGASLLTTATDSG